MTLQLSLLSTDVSIFMSLSDVYDYKATSVLVTSKFWSALYFSPFMMINIDN